MHFSSHTETVHIICATYGSLYAMASARIKINLELTCHSLTTDFFIRCEYKYNQIFIFYFQLNQLVYAKPQR